MEKTVSDRNSIFQSFSACPLCGHMMATLSAMVGNENMESIIENRKGPWLEYPWQPTLSEALVRYYDLHFKPDVEWFSGHCPLCRRRFTFQRGEESAILRIEGMPGTRSQRSGRSA